MGEKKIIATFYIGIDNISVEVWLSENETPFIAVRYLQYRSFFSMKLWNEYIAYSDTLLQSGQEGCRVLGTKKQLSVRDSVVKCTTRETPPHHFCLDAVQWLFLLEIDNRIQKVLKKEEKHYLVHCYTNAYLMMESTTYPHVVLEPSDVQNTLKGLKISEQGLAQLQCHTKDIEQRMGSQHGEDKHFNLDNETSLHMFYKEDNEFWNKYEFQFEKVRPGFNSLFLTMNEHDMCMFIMNQLPIILADMQKIKKTC